MVVIGEIERDNLRPDTDLPQGSNSQTSKDGVKTEATLEDCLALLRSPSDEKRFVALLLLSKLLRVQRDEPEHVPSKLI